MLPEDRSSICSKNRATRFPVSGGWDAPWGLVTLLALVLVVMVAAAAVATAVVAAVMEVS